MSYLNAVQDTLAAEHAATYLYAVLAAQTSRSGSPVLFGELDAAYAVHRDRRDEVTAQVRAIGAEPVAAQTAYAFGDLGEPTGPDAPRVTEAVALRLERACARVYATLVENSPKDRRQFALTALSGTALRELAFGGSPQPLPGSDDYTRR